jgi:hypothetical protein
VNIRGLYFVDLDKSIKYGTILPSVDIFNFNLHDYTSYVDMLRNNIGVNSSPVYSDCFIQFIAKVRPPQVYEPTRSPGALRDPAGLKCSSGTSDSGLCTPVSGIRRGIQCQPVLDRGALHMHARLLHCGISK